MSRTTRRLRAALLAFAAVGVLSVAAAAVPQGTYYDMHGKTQPGVTYYDMLRGGPQETYYDLTPQRTVAVPQGTYYDM